MNLDGILKLVENELETIIRNGKFRSREEIDTAYKLIDIVKDVHCVWKYEEDEGEYSGRGRSYRGRKRDSMGRYSGEMSRTDYIESLRSMADEAPDERTRSNINRMIREME